jgi:hypothetical protein
MSSGRRVICRYLQRVTACPCKGVRYLQPGVLCRHNRKPLPGEEVPSRQKCALTASNGPRLRPGQRPIVIAGCLCPVWGGVAPGRCNRRTQRNGVGGCPWNTARTPLRAVSTGRPRRFCVCAPVPGTGATPLCVVQRRPVVPHHGRCPGPCAFLQTDVYS